MQRHGCKVPGKGMNTDTASSGISRNLSPGTKPTSARQQVVGHKHPPSNTKATNIRPQAAINKLPSSNTKAASNKPQAVSKIASLWKSKSSPNSPTLCKPKPLTSTIASSDKKVSGPCRQRADDSPDYVVAISFREPPSSTSMISGKNVTETVKSASIECLPIDRMAYVQEPIKFISETDIASKSDFGKTNPKFVDIPRKAEKTAAIVSPFMYRPQASGMGAAHSDPSGIPVAAQSSYYGLENKITVHLDIKPCITVSDGSPIRATMQTPLTHTEPLAGSMTKTEMLLRRKSEILHRQRENNSTTASKGMSSSRYKLSKTTDV